MRIACATRSWRLVRLEDARVSENEGKPARCGTCHVRLKLLAAALMKEVRMRGKIMALDESMTDRQPETQGKETYSTSC